MSFEYIYFVFYNFISSAQSKPIKWVMHKRLYWKNILFTDQFTFVGRQWRRVKMVIIWAIYEFGNREQVGSQPNFGIRSGRAYKNSFRSPIQPIKIERFFQKYNLFVKKLFLIFQNRLSFLQASVMKIELINPSSDSFKRSHYFILKFLYQRRNNLWK